MKRFPLNLVIAGLLIFSVSGFSATAESLPAVSPAPRDRCPVCGMFVARYPDWIAQIRFRDEKTLFFDGAKDFFKYYFRLDKQKAENSKADAVALYVTDYYTMESIDASAAFYVVGSDVYGPMGHELIAFEKVVDAEAFIRDHQGRQILKFSAVTPDLLRDLDR